MNRTGLIIALVIAAVVGVLFGFFPQLDLAVSHYFYEYVDANRNVFAWRINYAAMFARDTGLWIGALLIMPAIGALVVKLLFPRRKLLMSGRAIVFLIVTLGLGPGLLVNGALKEYWGRPRPIDVTQFGGDQHFVSWWDPRGDCPSNCSFVSGDASGAFWTLAPAALAPPQWQALAYGAALALGTGMGILRIMAGGHFVTDVVFAGIFTFLIIWVVYALIYRWPRTRFSDAAVERAIEFVVLPVSDFFAGLFTGKIKSPDTRPPDKS
jgi:membrane-associated PAP2 superfamily phosphatase